MLLWLAWILGIIGSCAAVDGLIHVLYAFVALRRFENAPLLNAADPPEDAAVGESLVIETSDGIALSGVAYFPVDGLPRAVVVFCPETGGTAATALNYIPSLLEQGIAVVAFDFRGQGMSGAQTGYRPNCWMTEFELIDLRSTLDFVAAQPQFEGLPVGLVGVSRGANVALAVAGERPEIRHLWVQGGFLMEDLVLRQSLRTMTYVVGSWTRLLPHWHIRATLWLMFRLCEFRNGIRFPRLAQILPALRDRELMFVSGDRDSYVLPESTRTLCLAAQHDPESCVWTVAGAKHNLERPAASVEYDRRMGAFFAPLLTPATAAFLKSA